jgi:signal transduction histidine kinase
MNPLRSNPDKHRPSLLGLPLVAAAALMLVGMLALDLLGSRQKVMEDGVVQIEQHDRILAEHVARSFDSIEVLLDEMRIAIQEGGWQHWTPAQGHQHIKSRLSRSLPQIRHLLIFDAEGFQRHTSFSEAPPMINVRDRVYFRQLLDGAERARYGPYTGRNSNRPTYALTRRLTNASGKFSGALVVAIEPEYFEAFCRSTRPLDEFEAAIVNAEGVIISLCRSLAAEPVKTAGIAGEDFRKVLARGEFAAISLTMNRSSVENSDFIMATEPVPGYPDLRVVSVTPKSALMRGWHKHMQQVLLLAALALSTLAAAFVLTRRQFRQLETLTSELKSNQELLEERIAKTTEELNQKRNEAERMAEAKSRFFAAASHDLRQPLHALQLFLGDLARLSESPEQRVLVQRIESATHAMTGQLRSMLDISRLDMANIVPQRATLQLIDLFDQLVATYSPAAEAARVRLLFRPRSATLETDAALLIRLLGNLVDNAIKFSPGGTVLVCARWRANAVRIEIRDNGKGIPPAHQKAIYDEFFQVGNDARNPGAGLGLGLSIAHRIARLLGANISLRSAAARGTTFALTLPCVVGHRPQPSTTPASATRLILIGPPGDFAERAKRWGYVVELAGNAESAWRLMQEGHAIPLVIHDGSAGFPSDLQSLLRQHPGVVITPAGCHIPELGAYHLLEPIKPARLRALLRSLH